MPELILGILGALLAAFVAILLLIYIVLPLFKGVGFLITGFFKGVGLVISHIFRFVSGEIGDSLRIVGAVITAVLFMPLVILSIIIGRWSASAHFGRAVQNEVNAGGASLYRVLIGHPAKLLGLTALTEGIELRIPEAVAHAPGADKPSKRTGQFEGYTIVGSLPSGGSGAKLYVAEPDTRKLAALSRLRQGDVTQVIIKSFNLHDGSTLPQIVRESRALEAAKDMGLVLEHELNDQRFFYVMPYVHGEALSETTHALHASSGADGLAPKQLHEALGYAIDLVRTLDRYHRGGLWHKDVKPDNVIISEGHAHLVDLGLVTPLRSAMTLTTHGTEYFRDPEMVRMALKGVKVHEVDGAKFDIYALGAVLYSIVENSFPAHGGLSQVNKRCPETVRWIIRRAMTDYDSRYNVIAEMAADLNAVIEAPDPFVLKPIDLPSMKGLSAAEVDAQRLADAPAAPAHVQTPVPHQDPVAAAVHIPGRAEGETPSSQHEGHAARRSPHLFLTNWWTGAYEAHRRSAPRQAHDAASEHSAHADRPRDARFSPIPPSQPRVPQASRASASEQLKSARARVNAAQKRATSRLNRHRYSNSPNSGVVITLLSVVAMVGLLFLAVPFGVALLMPLARPPQTSSVEIHTSENNEVEVTADVNSDVDADADAMLKQYTFTLGSLGEINVDLPNLDNLIELRDNLEEAIQALRTIDTDTIASASGGETQLDQSGSLLVLVDPLIRTSASDSVRRQFDEVVADASSRLHVVGLGDDADELRLIASAWNTIGKGQPQDPETGQRLAGWLGEHPDQVGALLWAQLGDSGDTVDWHVFSDSRKKASAIRRLLPSARR